ncbi:OLC1v1003078C1 [Oldenlandia corymbosa var. corymbosa]|uniref:OLC1v1003078C1 n=1 Tax=Oldenlandia corymbosa var. corymbosa TaxID=529605 RepID=A0AAV1DC25_OLDCO|nr:OLC1v1003078C1 [Oldenlandia corymbosa var. corymbosa]
MKRISSSRNRCLWSVSVFGFMGCLYCIHLLFMINQSLVFLPDETSEFPNNHDHNDDVDLASEEELKFPTFSSTGLATDGGANLLQKFLDKDSEIRTFIFPDATNAIDPRKGNDQFYYYPGRIWLDLDGNPIQAHGGGILYDKISRKYYWYGENKNGPTKAGLIKDLPRVDIVGVGCYSSNDLWTWKNEGIVLKAEETNKNHDLYKTNVLERPKVIYNEETGKYVMWMHIDNGYYNKAAVGVAISGSPTGPFSYLYSMNPHGFDSRDMTVFKDDDGTAYLFYDSLHNLDMHVSQLSRDYLHVTNVVKILVGKHREAPAVFKHRAMYYMITSGCTGWAPNEALVHVAESIMGPWEVLGNPCVGANKIFRDATFFSQSTFVLPMPGAPPGTFVFLADRWKPEDLRDSRYVWLPLTVEQEAYSESPGDPVIPEVSIYWHKRWKIPYKRSSNDSSSKFLIP